jgi:DNA-binding response OmpR family regulator
MTTILIAEDERDIRDLIAFTLKYNGYEVLTASNGEEAFQLTLSEKPDLVLLDVRMPRMDGYEVCRRIKDNPDVRNLPVVFISAKGQEREVQEGLAAGAIDYILKPFSPDELIRRLKNALSQSH